MAIEERLRFALATNPGENCEGVDMSDRAITQRLLESCEMSSLCLTLVELGASAGLRRRGR